MKKRILSIILVLCMCMTLFPSAVLADSSSAAGIADYNVEVGKSISLHATGVLHKWLSSNENVLTVSDNGVVTAVAPGTAIVTLVSYEGVLPITIGNFKSNIIRWGRAVNSYVIKVNASSDIDENVIQVKEGETVQLTSPSSPAKWRSSDTDVATVSAKGVVTGISAGDTTVSVTYYESAATNPITGLIRLVKLLVGNGRGTAATATTEFNLKVVSASVEPEDVFYTVSFESNGGSAVESQQVKSGECAAEPETPECEGLFFGGWYSDEELTISYDFASPVTENITVYARWLTDVEDYFTKNAELIEIIDADESEDVLSEAEAVSLLDGRGLSLLPITYQYTLDGQEVNKVEASKESADKHPMYKTNYVVENCEGWNIYIVNGAVIASPVSFNLESDLGVEVLVSESNTITSYDENANRFYVTEPKECAAIVVAVDSIDAETLNSLTIDELCRLTGATPPADDAASYDEASVNDENYTEEPLLNAVSASAAPRLSMAAPTALAAAPSLSAVSASSSNNDPFIVVSLGDSYASGEGVPHFMGYDKPIPDRFNDENFLAHRSQTSWASLLTVPGVMSSTDKLGNYFVNVSAGETSNAPIQWYFEAASGAQTKHFEKKSLPQDWNYVKYDPLVGIISPILATDLVSGTGYLPPQLDVFDQIDGTVDLVTLSIGGNDVGFSDIVKDCVLESSYVHSLFDFSKLQKMMDEIWATNNIKTVKNNIKNAYIAIHEKAPQAQIIVVGYPKLFEQNGKGVEISKDEAELVNKNVTKFNKFIKDECVGECSSSMDICFVDVETTFNTHEAYSSEPWLNPIMYGTRSEDLKAVDVNSRYSMHPNATGVQKYADRVNEKIAEIFSSCDVCGTVTIADEDTDMTNNIPLEGACVIINGNGIAKTAFTDSNGEYTLPRIPFGTYTVSITREGFITTSERMTISDTNAVFYNIAIEAVPSAYSGIGYASGKIIDASTGMQAKGLTLYVRRGLNNTEGNPLITVISTDGTYTTTGGLEAGNYTIQVVDERSGISDNERYVTNSFNVKILGNMNIGNQNGYVSNGLYEEELRIVLTWGQNPSDLDSHLSGPTSNGGKYHIYYSNKEYTNAADLDVDDTSSYGPETITIHSFDEGIYTYAIHDYTNRSYSNTSGLANSGAQVKVYRGQSLIMTFNVPTNKDGTLWTVFSYDTSTKTFKTINTITYCSSDTSSILM